MQHQAPFVWTDGNGEGRSSHAYFRYDLTLSKAPEHAVIHLFADSNYHLRVNGKFIGFGPVRFYPEHPEYDTYDLTPFLSAGPNVIAVHALHLGIPTFHQLYNRGGFSAWGEVVTAEGETLKLDTPNGWLSSTAHGYDRTTPKFSFALPPIQVFDERLGIKDWDQAGLLAASWKQPVLIEKQDSWGAMEPRSIPPFSHEERTPKSLLSAHLHANDEEIYSFRVGNFEPLNAPMASACQALAYTYIHSPCAQSVTVGLYWGEHYLNGEFLEKKTAQDEEIGRNDIALDLNAGWNYFFVSYGIVGDTWDFHMAIPREAGLSLSPNKEENDPTIFMTAGPIPTAASPILSGNSHYDIASSPAPWTPQVRLDVPVLPVKHLAWIHFGPSLELSPDHVADLAVEEGRDTSFVFDMGGVVLGRIFVEYDAPAGTVFDVGIAEELRGARPYYAKSVTVIAGDRQIARGGAGRMETFYPRGFRYLHLAVVNNDGPVKIRKIGVVTHAYPHQRVGQFQCSDPLLNEIWEMGWRTLKLCSEDTFTDCPWRERTLYAGDMLPEWATALVTSGDTQLVRRCLNLFLQSQSPETQWQQSMAPIERSPAGLVDYPLITLLTAEWYVRYTNDLAFAKSSYPKFRAMMEKCLEARQPNGLFSSLAHPFIEHGHKYHGGISSALNAILVRAWTAITTLAVRLGYTEDVKRYQALSSETAEAIRTHFWDDTHGAFVDEILKGERVDARSGISSAWCSLFGATTPSQEAAILQFYKNALAQATPKETEPVVSVYGAFFLLGGLYAHGHEAFAEEFMRTSWKPMVDADSDTIWEFFDPANSLTHAWSTAPNFYLSTRVLGVRIGFPEETDFDSIVIAPQAETIEWASGIVPHPRGPVSVEWRVEGSRLVMKCDVPPNVRWHVAPTGRLAELELWVNDGRYPG